MVTITARRASVVLFSLLALAAPFARAATYIVPTDAELVDEARAIFSGWVTSSTPRFTPDGDIETVFTVRVEEHLKGGVPRTTETVVEWGGRIGDRWMKMSGAPEYRIGQKYLIFAIPNRNGEWATEDLALGGFEFATGSSEELLVRQSDEIVGWETDGSPHVERTRRASAFLEFVRDRVAGRVPRTDYLTDAASATPSIVASKIEPNFVGYDFDEASQTGASAWTDESASDVSYSISSIPASGDTKVVFDSEERIIEEDPHGDIAGSFTGSGVVATAFYGGGGSNVYLGKTYDTITASDVVTQDGLKASGVGQSVFRTTMVHELGHTLGFRHSNQKPDGSGCAAPLPCTSSAVMNSSVAAFNGVLQGWDIDAVRATYGSVGDGTQYVGTFDGSTPIRRANSSVAFQLAKLTASCNAPVVSTQPQNKNVSQGSVATLTVAATGTSPFTFQWFRGSSGDTSQPIAGQTSSSLNVDTSVAGSFNFWVRVGHTCDSATANSNTATVTVTCAAPGITSQPQNRNIFEGSAAQLSVGVTGSGLTFQWFVGTSGDTSTPVVGGTTSSIVVSPASTTSYWVRVSGSCGPDVNSNTATVTVVPCGDVTVDAPTATPTTPGKFTLSVTAFSTNTPLTFSWFRGTTPGFGGTLVGSTQSINVTVTTVTSFWVRVTNGCGKSDFSGTITVAPCTLPSITTQPNDQSIGQGASATLSIVSNGTTVTWFKGTVGNTTQQVGTGNSFNTGALTATTQYWAQVSNSCGSVSSRQVTVTVQTASEQVKLLNSRFTVEVRYVNQLVNPPTNGKLKGRSLFSSSISETAIFSFDDPLVVELMVRVSDARPFDNHIHVYLGGLSDVEFFITVSDSLTGTVKEYHKLPFELKGQVDRSTFAAGNSLQDGIDSLIKTASLPVPNADSSTIKLLGNRFQVRMRYRNPFVVPNTEGFLLGRSIASSTTTETAVFYFDNPESVEWMVRFSDARPFAQRIDLFHGGLSDVEFTIEVIDTVKGTTREYSVPAFSLAGAVDRGSFTP